MTFLKLSFSSLCRRTSAAYTVLGEEPVARPSTHFSLRACLALMVLAISRAMNSEPSLRVGKMVTGTFSNESTMLMLYCFYGLRCENKLYFRESLIQFSY